MLFPGAEKLIKQISAPTVPADVNVSAALQKLDAETVHQLWLKAMERRENDPEGAITLARPLLESVANYRVTARHCSGLMVGAIFLVAARTTGFLPVTPPPNSAGFSSPLPLDFPFLGTSRLT